MKGPEKRVVGFDCAEEEHVAVVLDEDGDFERRLNVGNRRDQVQESLAQLILAVGSGERLVIVVEFQPLMSVVRAVTVAGEL